MALILYAKMENGEEILITRKYAKEIEDYFMKEDDTYGLSELGG